MSEVPGGFINSDTIDPSLFHWCSWCVHQAIPKHRDIWVAMQVLAKSSRTSAEPEQINPGLELTFAEDTSVHLNCIHCVFL